MKRCGIVVHDTECGDLWARRLEGSGLDLLGIHPAGGPDAHLSLVSCMETVRTPAFRAFRRRANAAGLAVEFEMHALSWLLPRDLFGDRPEWFREENGARTPRFNCCASDPDALRFVAGRAAELAAVFPSDTHRYHFWPDDVAEAKCSCPRCRGLSASDQALVLANAVAEGVRRTDPAGRAAYLAYGAALEPPRRVRPAPGVFLEFAPMDRDHDRPLFDPASGRNAGQVRLLPELLALFGTEDATALDYWTDNSFFSKWTRPPARFARDAAVCRADAAAYARAGFEAVTCFACFLGEDYEARWGAPPLDGFLAALRAARRP